MAKTMKRYKFSNKMDQEFFTTLKSRVNAHFVSNNIEKHGDYKIIVKTVVMALLYFTPYVLILAGIVTNPVLYIFMWVLMGLGAVGLGVNVMHDANHGAFTKNQKLNDWLGRAVNVIGGNARTWKLQHNVLHHAYTNVEGMDHDLAAPPILRFSPHQKLYWIHRFQYIYAWFLYGLQTFMRAFVSDFRNAIIFKKKGLVRSDKDFKKLIKSIAFWKVMYFSYILVLPILFAPVSVWLTLGGFVALHFTAGLLMAMIFQSAHVMPECEFPVANDQGTIENNWAVHQMMTTTNFSPKSKVFSWFVGGLNYQIEHHLFSNICHTHYRDISKIVSKTAKEFGVKYNLEKSFFTAILNHGRMLKQLGV